MINAKSIARMKRGVMIVNTGRGLLVNSKDLIEGLKSGQVGYAGLDVYEEESSYFYEDDSNEIIDDEKYVTLETGYGIPVDAKPWIDDIKYIRNLIK